MTGDLQIKCPSHRAEHKRHVRQWERRSARRGRNGTAVLSQTFCPPVHQPPTAHRTASLGDTREAQGSLSGSASCTAFSTVSNGLKWGALAYEHTDQTNQTTLRDRHLHGGRNLRRFHHCRLRPCGGQCPFRKIIGKIGRHEPSACTGKDRPGGHGERRQPRHGKRLRDGQRRQRPLDPGGTESQRQYRGFQRIRPSNQQAITRASWHRTKRSVRLNINRVNRDWKRL